MSTNVPLSTSVNVEKLVADVKECVEDLGSEFANCGVPIDDDNQTCQKLCGKIEQFLSIGFIEKISLFGRRKSSYWDFLKTSLISTKGGVDSAIKFANYNPEVHTSIGRGRAFLRYCLAHGCLADAIQQSLMATDTVASWYSASAPMRDETLAQELVSATYALADINFDLAPGGHDLDTSWPSFRRQFNSPSRNLSWKPLSRSTSFTSLSSSFSLDPSSPPPGSMGAMGSLPEDPPQTDRRSAHTSETGQNEAPSRTLSPTEEIRQLVLEHRGEVTGLIHKYETEIKTLSDQNTQLEQQLSQLRLEKDEWQNEREEVVTLRTQVTDLQSLNQKIAHFEAECQRLQTQLQQQDQTSRSHSEDRDTELHELKMKLRETQSENNNLKTSLSSLEVECSKMTAQVEELEIVKLSLEASESRCLRYKEQMLEGDDLRKKLSEMGEDYERVVEKLKTEETRWGAEMEQKVQQAKWEMGSLQKCVDNLLKENEQLREDLTKASTTMSCSRDKYSTSEMYVQKLTEQVTALKDVVAIGKQMLGMRDTEVAQLQRKVQNLEGMLESEREKNLVLANAFKPEALGDSTLRQEYESQLENIRALKTIYSERIEIMQLENEALKAAGEDRNRQIELMTKRYQCLEEQYKRLEEELGRKEQQQQQLQAQVSASGDECKALTTQLTTISNLLVELGRSGMANETVEEPEASEETASGSVEGSCYKSVDTPGGPQVVISVSQTFLRLKDLILEKKSLEKELGNLRNLNSHLETKLRQQERRLSLVLQELKKTWGVVNKMRTQHSQLRTSEAILRYDLQQKRKVVNELKEELQLCNDMWKKARTKTQESEDTWRELRDEFASRRRQRPAEICIDDSAANSAESGYSDDRGDDESSGSTSEGDDPKSASGSEPPTPPPVVPAPVEEVTTMTSASSALAERLEARDARLRRMEEQASQLFRTVVRTSNMSVAISNRLEELHEQYGPGEGEEQQREARRLLRKPRSEEEEDGYEARRLQRKERRESAKAEARLREEAEARARSGLRLRISPARVEVAPKVTKEAEALAEKVSLEKTAREEREADLARLAEEVQNQNEAMAQLRKELKRMEKTLEDESTGREEMRQTLATTSKECVDLIQQVQELSEVESKLQTQLAAKEQLLSAQAEEMAQLEVDVRSLQEHVLSLVQQKEKLFKQCYELKKASQDRLWQHDSQAQFCNSCRVPFSLLVRKHHCRHCGHIFCGTCSSHWLPVSKESSRRTRSCSECHTKFQDTSETVISGASGSTEGSAEAASYVVRPDSDDEEDFSVISEDDVNLSQCVPYTPNPEILQYWKTCEVQSGMTRRVAEMLGHCIEEEVWVRAGVIYGVPLLVRAEDLNPQVNITWQFSTEPNCIAFSVLYKQDADVPPENSSIMVPTTRVNSHLHPIKGRLKARREGLYTLMFDNSYSRFTGKKLKFSLACEVGPTSGRSSADPESPIRSVSKSPSKEFKPVEEST